MSASAAYRSGKDLLSHSAGARAAVRLTRELGGAPVYIPAATPNYSSITPAEVAQIKFLHRRGFYNREIAALTGRSVSSIGPILFGADLETRCRRGPTGFRCLPKPQSAEGKIIRAALRRGESVTIHGRTYSPPAEEMPR